MFVNLSIGIAAVVVVVEHVAVVIERVAVAVALAPGGRARDRPGRDDDASERCLCYLLKLPDLLGRAARATRPGRRARRLPQAPRLAQLGPVLRAVRVCVVASKNGLISAAGGYDDPTRELFALILYDLRIIVKVHPYSFVSCVFRRSSVGG